MSAMKNALLNHRNTSIYGVSAIAVAVGAMLMQIFDGDPMTNPDFHEVVLSVVVALQALGFVSAADAKPEGAQH